ncbi:uncharacterized protein LOC122384023 [Amphibalanus amphitrite]|uniref:uncharacterized protein LOC122384023 n=1 Tax=Amphibalanus amphitrite TaxID=1232801 RepID=UPI001C9050AE|nr:uncharacterized protein LOC122384023 [Amphibalanus amphitrite]
MEPKRFLYLVCFLLLCLMEFRPVRATRIPRKRSIPYTYSASSWSSPHGASTWSSPYWPSTSPGPQYMMDTGRLRARSWPSLLSQMKGPPDAPAPSPAQVPGLEPSPVSYLPLPALLAALRAMTPASVGVSAAPTVCVHTHPGVAAPASELSLGDLLTPGRDSQAQTLQMLLDRLMPGGSVLASRTPASSGTRRPGDLPDLSFLSGLGLGLLNPDLFRSGAEDFPRPSMSEADLRAVAAAERNAGGRPTLRGGNPDSEMFPRSVQSSPEPSEADDSQRISMLLSANGGDWANRIDKRRRRRSVSHGGQRETRHQMSQVLSKIIRRIGFEKYSEALRVIIQDLQPLKEAMNAAQRDLSKVQRTYHKFENDLNGLLEQTREAQQILLFILSSLFQENIVMRGKLEECHASKKVITARMRFPDNTDELNNLRHQLESRINRYDTLIINLIGKKSELEVERQRLRERCNVPIDSGTQPDPFSLSTFLSLMTGIGEPSSAQRDINILLMRLFPDLYPTPPPPPPPPAPSAPLRHTATAGSPSGWLQVLIPMMNTRRASQPLHFPFVAPSSVSMPYSFANQYLLRHSSPLRTSSPLISQPTDNGDEFIMSMLQLMLQLYSAQPDQVDENRMKEELVNFGRALLC